MLGGIPLDTVKNEREEVIDLFEFPDLRGADQEDCHRHTPFGLVLGHHLAAGTAWGSRGFA